jgi:two-component system phosphate regulon sensor histidine kinase PhoR
MAWPSLRITALIAAVPLAGLAVLSATGSTPPVAALAVAGAILAAALLLAAAWQRDLILLADLLRRATIGGPLPHPSQLGHAPLLLPDATLRDIALVSQTLGDRTDELERLRRTDESILERLPDPLIVLGPDRAVRRANAAARTAFGADMAAVLRHPDLRGAIDRALADSITPRAQTADVSVPVPVPREVQATVVALHSPLAGGQGALVVLSDRTRERAVERMRADFVANASHELRTPLASLIGFIDTLRGPAADDPPAQARFLDIMAEQAGRMNRLIDDLLSLSRIELTEHQMPAEAVAMPDLVERMLAAFEIRLKERRITLDLWMAPDVPAITGDHDQLEQVFQNLFDNAVKYGREGGLIRVGLECVPPGGKFPARPGVILSVADDGAGIPRQHLPRLTERFYRVDTGRSRAVGGTGLGLAIVKHVVNRHRGQLLIESEEGRGTSFTVWLPVA